MRFLRLATAILLLAAALPGVVAGHDSPLGAAGSTTEDLESVGATAWITPETTRPGDGTIETTFHLPSGSVIKSITPPPAFKPLEASDEELAKYGFPLPPSDAEDYEAWHAAMAVYRPSEPPTEPVKLSSDAPRYLQWDVWGGYSAGTLQTQNHTYVAVKGNFTVPTNNGTCALNNGVAFWIGLGGTGGTYAPYNLVQQGIGCGNPGLGTGSGYKAWTEFAKSDPAFPFCGFAWTLAAGHVIYQNMSFQTSQNKAFFYMEDQTSGISHACEGDPPTGWHWDLNTAEWIGEAPSGTSVDFDSVHFTNARAQLNSNGNWVTLGSQLVTQWIEGTPGFVNGKHYECINPGAIYAGTAFYDYWISTQQGACFPP